MPKARLYAMRAPDHRPSSTVRWTVLRSAVSGHLGPGRVLNERQVGLAKRDGLPEILVHSREVAQQADRARFHLDRS